MRPRIGRIAFGLAGIIALLLVVEYLPAPRPTYFWDRAFDTGHILIFGLITILCLLALKGFFEDRSIARQYFGAGLITACLGVGLEIWQRYHHRSAELIDLFNDLIGIMAFTAIFAIFDRRITEPRQESVNRSILASFAIMSFILGAIPMLNTTELYLTRKQILPRLVDFQQPWHGIFYYAQSADMEIGEFAVEWPLDELVTHRVVAKMTTKPGRYPGIVLSEPYNDWSGYRYLELEVYYAEEEGKRFQLRVHDAAHNHEDHDRYRAEMGIEPGYQKIRIPLSDIQNAPAARQMDLRQIAGLAFFTTNLDHSVTFYIRDIRLAR